MNSEAAIEPLLASVLPIRSDGSSVSLPHCPAPMAAKRLGLERQSQAVGS